MVIIYLLCIYVNIIYSFAIIFLIFVNKKRDKRKNVTFIEFKKTLLDAEISLPKFSKLIKVSEKNIQSYKKKGEVPNPIAVVAQCFAHMNSIGVDYRPIIEELQLTAKTKKGVGFAKKHKTHKEESEESDSL